MKPIQAIVCATALIAFASCSGCGTRHLSPEEREIMLDCAYCSYDDMVSFIVEGYQMDWSFETRPSDYGMSDVYCYSSPHAGFLKRDIDGNGIVDLILGENPSEGPTVIYDIMTIDTVSYSRVCVVSGGERDRLHISGNRIVEVGSNSASDSFVRCYSYVDGRLTDEESVIDESECERLELDTFIRYASSAGDSSACSE